MAKPKRIPKPVTRIVRRFGEYTLMVGKVFASRHLVAGIGGVPCGDYKVTYYPNRRGDLRVDKDQCVVRRIDREELRKAVCWLGPIWYGLRVSRRVEPIR